MGKFEDDLARKKEATRLTSRGIFITMGIGEIIAITIWLFNHEFIIIPISLMLVSGMIICSITYRLVQNDKVRVAGYFLIGSFLLYSAITTHLFGGYAGPFSVIYFFVILVSGIVISVDACFYVATIATFLYLAMICVESTGWLPQIIKTEAVEATISSLTIGVQIVFFYLITFLSWFASSRLTRALDKLHRNNENLQLSEEELRTSNEELQAAEEELRTANEELKEAQEQLVRSEKLAAIGKLAGGIGHELRNPLGAIKNAAYYVKGKVAKSELAQKEPKVSEFLSIIEDEINSSNKIISDLLNFSRVTKPTVAPTNIRKVVEDVLARLTVPENITIINKVHVNLPDVEIDADQIRQVFINISDNAIHAMPEGGKLTIDARKGDKFLEVIFSDTGNGIPYDVIGKVFEPLFTTRAKGIGLGLAVCESIIERHGGSIKVDSMVGEGATFTVTLPLNTDKGVAHG